MRTKVLLFSLFLVLLVPVYADSFVTMTLTRASDQMGSAYLIGPTNGVGEPVSPYQAQVGNNTFLVCLDMQLSTYVGQGYTTTSLQMQRRMVIRLP